MLRDDELIIHSFRSVLDYKDEALHFKGLVFAVAENGAIIAHETIGEGVDGWDRFDEPISWDEENALGPNAIGRSMKTLATQFVSYDEHTSPSLNDVHSVASTLTISTGNRLTIGLLVCKTTEQSDALRMLNRFTYVIENTLVRQKADAAIREINDRNKLLHAIKTLHSLIDVNSVLAGALESLQSIYPDVDVDLFLSQDNHNTKLSVKPLVLDDTEDDICALAFMTGTVQLQRGDEHVVIAAPLVGKQGVYGVFQLTFDAAKYRSDDIEFVSEIADAAGTAFENAKLYEQSNLLISELRLINEITRRLNQSLKLQDIFSFASNELIKIFDANYGCILKLDRASDHFVVEATNLPSFTNEIISTSYGFSSIVYKTKEPLIISDYSQSKNVESKLMLQTNSRSLIATPIIVNYEVVGAIFVTHREPNFFTYENYKLLQVITVHIGLAIANASLHAELRRMVITDNLTSLYTRSYLDEQVALMQKRDYCGALIMVDIDYFKEINDTYGHQVGDRVLIQIGKIVVANIRETDIAARWGGEELAIYLPLARLEHTQKIAERIRLSILNETDPPVTVSCGIALWHCEDETISVESLFYRADMALYKAKNEGRNRTIIG